MSIIIKCDGYDCDRCDHNYDKTLYQTSDEVKIILKNVFNENYEHLCIDCFNDLNTFDDGTYKLTTFEDCEMIIKL